MSADEGSLDPELTKVLIKAVKLNDGDLIKDLLTDGASVNAKHECGYCALHYAVIYNSADAVRALLVNGHTKCDIEQRDPDGNTPLHMAIRLGHQEIAQLLLMYGANVSAVTKNGYSALELAKKTNAEDFLLLMNTMKQSKRRRKSLLPREWKLGRFLGCGAFGKVHIAHSLKDSREFAVKRLEANGRKVSLNKELCALGAEIEVLKTLSHPRIVQYYGMQKLNSVTYIFMEYLPGGSIHDLTVRCNGLPEEQVSSYTKQILEGVAYLHSNMIIHRDIKGANILLSDDSQKVKLGDFGLSQRLQRCSTISGLKTTLGSPCWMAPEVMRASPQKGEGYGRKADIWSIGCTIVEMLTTMPPWADMEPMAIIYNVGSGERVPNIPTNSSSLTRSFLDQIFKRDPRRRPSASELLCHQFITDGPSSSKDISNKEKEQDMKTIKREDQDCVTKPLQKLSPRLQRICGAFAVTAPVYHYVIISPFCHHLNSNKVAL